MNMEIPIVYGQVPFQGVSPPEFRPPLYLPFGRVPKITFQSAGNDKESALFEHVTGATSSHCNRLAIPNKYFRFRLLIFNLSGTRDSTQGHDKSRYHDRYPRVIS